MAYTTKDVFVALSNVKYPGTGKDISALGMVQEIKIEDKKISFSLIFKKSNDPNIESLRKDCVNAILTNLGQDVEIKGNITVKSIEKVADKSILPNIKNIIAIASGKGGVGKSTVTTNLAVALAKAGNKVGLVDADIFGPSIPKMFGVENERPEIKKENGADIIIPIEKFGLKLLSIGFFVNPEEALVWRGPMATNALKQLVFQTEWGKLDYLLFDLPPGTSDIHLTLVQEVPVTGAVIVSTPQQVALADAVKGINMFKGKQINVPVLGLVENMAWFTPAELPNNKYYIFGKDGCKNLSAKMKIPLLGQIPIVQSICENGDNGNPSALDENSVTGKSFADLAQNVVNAVNKRNTNLDPTKKVEISNNDGCDAVND
ncbi:MAG: Mrp/NBP35 family ATP-binding protein [Bacteroidetes bacterium]|nr:Mrp/NBP35 family ATP-binding protein [Bacteroidota bacterium]